MLDQASEPSSVPLLLPTEASPEAAPPLSPPARARRPILPVERLGAFIEVVLCSGFPTQILVFAAMTALGLRLPAEDGGWQPSFVAIMSMADMVLVLGLVYLFLRAHQESVREFLLGPRRPVREVLLGFLLVPAAFGLVVLIGTAIFLVKPELYNVSVNPFERMLQNPRDAALFAFVVMFAGGVREEVQRAFVIRRFDTYLGGGAFGVLIHSTIFGLGHVDQGYAAAITTGALGAGWGVLYLVRGSVIAPMVSHAGFNLAQLLKYVTLASR